MSPVGADRTSAPTGSIYPKDFLLFTALISLIAGYVSLGVGIAGTVAVGTRWARLFGAPAGCPCQHEDDSLEGDDPDDDEAGA